MFGDDAFGSQPFGSTLIVVVSGGGGGFKAYWRQHSLFISHGINVMYPRNAASPEPIAIGAVIQISDGAVQTSGCTVRIKPMGVAEGDGAGTTAYSTDGIVLYTPTQAETNYTSFVLIAKKTSCLPVSVTVVTTASATAGYAGTDQSKIANPTSTVALTGTTIATTQKVDVETIKTNPVVNAGTVTFPTTATLASTTNITAGTITTVTTTTTATNVTTVNGLAAGVITAASIAADAITDAKVASDVTIASVTGAVGSVTGAVGSVTGNVGGNVTGSVGSIATGGIAAASFAAGAIDATAIATDAIGADEISAAAVTKIQTGLSTLTQTQVSGGAYALNSASFAFNAALDFTTTQKAATLARVTLVDTTTTNTDMRGTDNAATAANLATVAGYIDTEVAAIKAVTDAIGATGSGLSAIPWNAAWDAEVQSEVDDALVAQNLDHLVKIAVDTNFATTVHLDSVIGQLADNGTTATFDRTTDSQEAIRDRGDAAWITATGFSTLDAGGVRTAVGLASANLDTQIGTLATAANLATVAGYLDTEIAAILADTNELQTDWVNGGRLDLILDSRASQTSVDTVDGIVDAILVDTAEIGAAGAGLTALATAANLATANTALAKLDDTVEDNAGTYRFTTASLVNAPSGSGLDAAATRAALGMSSANLDAQLSAIVADTNELQTDWVNGGRLDLILDATATQASVNTIDDFLDTEIAAIKTTTDRLETTWALNSGSYRFTAAALALAPSGTTNVTVTPTSTSISDRVTASTITCYYGEAGFSIGPNVVTDANGDPINLSTSYTSLRFTIQDQYGTDLLSTASVTVSGASSNQWTVTGTSAVTVSAPAKYSWSLRGISTGVDVVLGLGTVLVVPAAKVDS